MLRSEQHPLQPATLQQHGPCEATLAIREGRYHQIRRMFAAVDNRVEQLPRERIAPLDIQGLTAGTWHGLTVEETRAVYAALALPPTLR